MRGRGETLTFLPSNSWGLFIRTLSTLAESVNVTKPKPLFEYMRKRKMHVEKYKAFQKSYTYRDLLVVGSFMTMTSEISPNLLKYSRRPSVMERATKNMKFALVNIVQASLAKNNNNKMESVLFHKMFSSFVPKLFFKSLLRTM